MCDLTLKTAAGGRWHHLNVKFLNGWARMRIVNIKFHSDNKRQIQTGDIVDAESRLSCDLCIKNEAKGPCDGLPAQT